MSRSFLLSLLVSLLLLVSPSSAQTLTTYRNNIQVYQPPTTILQRGFIELVVEWETNYVGPLNLHFDLSDYTTGYTNYGSVIQNITGPGYGTNNMNLRITSNLNLGDVFQLHCFFTPNNYTTQNNSVGYGLGNDWRYSWADTYPTAVVSTTLNATNAMTLLYPPATIPSTGYVLFDVSYVSNLPNYTMLHIDISDTSKDWEWDGGSSIMVNSPSAGVVQFNVSVARFQNGGGALTIGDTIDINMYMTSGSDNMLYGTGNDWQHKNYSNTGTTVTVANRASFINNVYLINPPSVIPTRGVFTVQVGYSTNFSGQVNIHCDLNEASSLYNYAYEAGTTTTVTGPGAGTITVTLNITAVTLVALNTTHVFTLHTYLLDMATSQATGLYNDWQNALGSNSVSVYASNTYYVPRFDNFIELINAPAWIPNSGTVFLEVAWESNATTSTQLRVDLTDTSPYQNYAWGGGVSVTVPSPGYGKTVLQFNIVNGSNALLNQLDLWQFHVYTVSAANAVAYPDTVYAHASAEQYVPVVVSNRRLDNYAQIVNPPTYIPQTGSYTVDIFYVSNLKNQTVINLDINDLSKGWNWYAGTSVTVNSPSSGTVQLTLTLPASLNLTVGDNYVLQYYLTSIANSTNSPGNNWQNFQYEDRIYVQIAPTNTIINAMTPVNAPAQIPNTGSFTVLYSWSTSIVGLVNLHVEVSDWSNNYFYDGGAMIQVEGPASGASYFTITLSSPVTLGHNNVLHAFMTPNTATLDNGGSQYDWNYTVVNTYTPVQAVLPSQYVPYVWSDTVQFYRPPASIPNSGTVDLVVLYSSSAIGSTLIHVDLQDISTGYGWDGGFTTIVPSPGSGSVQVSIPIVSLLPIGDIYQFRAYSVSAANHTAHPSNEWAWQSAEAYSRVIVSNSPVLNFVQVLDVPTAIPSVGAHTFEIAYTTNFANDVVIHLDFQDQSWGCVVCGQMMIVSSPGSGTVMFTLTLTAAMALQTNGYLYNLKAYMTSIANDTAHGSGSDWQYSGYDNYNTVQVALPGTFVNSISPVNSPAALPTTGAFTVSYRYSTNISGLVDLHLDLSDTSYNYITGTPLYQISGPAQGTVLFTLSTNATATSKLTVGQSYILHAYFASAADGLEYGTGQDWSHSRGDSIITVPAASLADASGAKTPIAISLVQNPGTIPSSGYVEWTVEWSSSYPVASVLHIDLSDVSKNYSWGGGASFTVPTPGRGMQTLQLPIIGTLLSGDVWQAHVYITSIANATADPGNDWKHSGYDLYVPVVVSDKPLANYMGLITPPSTVPTIGTMTLDVLYISNCANSTTFHVDFSDVTQGWLYEAGASQTFPTPGTGTLTFTITTTAAMALKVGDQYDIHLYFTCANRVTPGNTLDWNNTAFDSTATTVQVAAPGTFINSLKPSNAPNTIPTTGNFSVSYLWSCSSTYPGLMNFHVDLTDSNRNTLSSPAPAMVQGTCPGSGTAIFPIQLPTSGLSYGGAYQLHAYMTPTDTSLANGASNDAKNSVFDGYTPVSAGVNNPGNNGGGSSGKSGLSGGAIAGIVIGSVVGAVILVIVLAMFVCAGRGRKGDKMDDDRVTGSHQRHQDEVSRTGDVEMGETHTTDEQANEEA